MNVTIYPVSALGNGHLFAMAKPSDQLLAQMTCLRDSHSVDKVVCLLEADEAVQLGLQHEQQACEAAGLEFEQFEIPDFGVPPTTALIPFVHRLHQQIVSGSRVVVHCRGGIGRTGLVCSCLLIASGMDALSAMALVTEQRGCEVPETEPQKAMVRNFSQLAR